MDHKASASYSALLRKGVQIFTHVVTQTKHSLNPFHRVGTSGGLKKANYLGWQGVAQWWYCYTFYCGEKFFCFVHRSHRTRWNRASCPQVGRMKTDTSWKISPTWRVASSLGQCCPLWTIVSKIVQKLWTLSLSFKSNCYLQSIHFKTMFCRIFAFHN